MKYYNIDLNKLIYELTEENDIGIDIDKIDKETRLSFKVLITKLSIETNENINLGNRGLLKIFDSEFKFKKMKKDDLCKVDLFDFSSNYTKWIVDRESNESKLFRLLLRRTKRGYSFTNNSDNSFYEINLPERTKIGINNLSFSSYVKDKLKNKVLEGNNPKPTFETSISLDKDYLKEYFKSKLSFYNRPLSELKNDDYFFNRSDESIKSEVKDFFKARFELDDYLYGRKEYLKVIYTIASSGRHYTFISSLNKNIRNEILKGYKEYDLENASVNYLFQVYNQIKSKKDIELNLIKYYLENKKEFRYKVASTISILETPTKQDLEDAKQILTSLFFGSKATKPKDFLDIQEEDKYKGAILNILRSKERQENFYTSTYLEKFTVEVRIMMDVINHYLRLNFFDKEKKILKVNHQEYNFRKNRKLSDSELTRVRTIERKLVKHPSRHFKRLLDKELEELKYSVRYSKNSAIAFLYQSWESNFMLGEIKAIKKEQKKGNKDFFLLHDAVYLKKDVDINLLINAEQSGDFKVKVNI